VSAPKHLPPTTLRKAPAAVLGSQEWLDWVAATMPDAPLWANYVRPSQAPAALPPEWCKAS